MTIEVAVGPGAVLGECPLWSVAEGVLYWIDIDGGKLHRLEPRSGEQSHRGLPARPGSIALSGEPGHLLVAIEHELATFDWEAETLEPWIEVEPAGTGNRLNDGRADPAGRFWVGSMYERPAERRATGMLHRVDPDGTVTTHRRGVGVSNSLAFAPDGRTMYWSDTHRLLVWAHDYDPASGVPGEPRPFADFTDLPGAPDGACTDETGAVWIAGVGGGALLRFTPEGSLDRTVELPLQLPTMPAFGGSRLETLYVTSIGPASSTSIPATGPLDGALLAVDVGVRGLAEPSFGRGSGSVQSSQSEHRGGRS